MEYTFNMTTSYELKLKKTWHSYEDMRENNKFISKLPETFYTKSFDELKNLCLTVYDPAGHISVYRDIHNHDFTRATLACMSKQLIVDHKLWPEKIVSIRGKSLTTQLYVQRIKITLPEGYIYTVPLSFLEIPDYFFHNPKM